MSREMFGSSVINGVGSVAIKDKDSLDAAKMFVEILRNKVREKSDNITKI